MTEKKDKRKPYTISMPGDLYEKMREHKKDYNISKICQDAILVVMEEVALYQNKIKEGKTPQEIIVERAMNSGKKQYETGKELGFIYAKNSKYIELDPIKEKYLENWKCKDTFVYGLIVKELGGLEDLLNSIGVVGEQLSYKEFRNLFLNKPEEIFHLLPEFVEGFEDGIMEFLNKVYKISKVRTITEDNKIFFFTIGKDNKLRFFIKKGGTRKE